MDLSKCKSELSAKGPESRSMRHLRKLEQRIVSETFERGLTVQRAADLAVRIGEFLRTQSPNEVIPFSLPFLRACGMMFSLMA